MDEYGLRIIRERSPLFREKVKDSEKNWVHLAPHSCHFTSTIIYFILVTKGLRGRTEMEDIAVSLHCASVNSLHCLDEPTITLHSCLPFPNRQLECLHFLFFSCWLALAVSAFYLNLGPPSSLLFASVTFLRDSCTRFNGHENHVATSSVLKLWSKASNP